LKPRAQETEVLVSTSIHEDHYTLLQKYCNHFNTASDGLMNAILEYCLNRPKLLCKIVAATKKR
jgi:hypothetical protein